MELVPAVLTNNIEDAEMLIKEVQLSQKFRRVQIDFIDGEYAANESIRVEECKSISNFPELKFDAQLMVVEKNVKQWAAAARELGFDRIIPQVESIANPQEYNCLAMDMHSPVKVLEPYLSKLNYVLVMSVEPGFGGQKFVDEAIDDIRELDKIRREKGFRFLIGVDGGIEREHTVELEDCGADELVVGAKRVLEWVK